MTFLEKISLGLSANISDDLFNVPPNFDKIFTVIFSTLFPRDVYYTKDFSSSIKWIFPSEMAMMKISASFPHGIDAPARTQLLLLRPQRKFENYLKMSVIQVYVLIKLLVS